MWLTLRVSATQQQATAQLRNRYNSLASGDVELVVCWEGSLIIGMSYNVKVRCGPISKKRGSKDACVVGICSAR